MKKNLSKTENKFKERKKEIKNFKKWRDKVFAHTAYASTKEEDNDATRLTTLKYFGGSILSYGKKSFQIGEAGINLGHNGEIKSKPFPVIDIAENHFKIMEHFKKWEEMFIKTLKEFKKIDKKDIMEKNKNIKDMHC
ncbi:hypothetical protein KAI65_01140 [Candidatus Parcubacteria bacterium]|nr:hypothetical protein [Candidatus Parcubacteria bacterium]